MVDSVDPKVSNSNLGLMTIDSPIMYSSESDLDYFGFILFTGYLQIRQISGNEVYINLQCLDDSL